MVSNMQSWFLGTVFAILTFGANAQQAINITGCTVPCNLGTAPADVLIFVDSSRGMGQANVNLIKSALIQWQSPFSVGNGSDDMLRVALVDYAQFATSHGLLVENHESHEELIDLINDINLHTQDNRNLYYGLIQGLTNINPEFGGLRGGDVPKIGMIFSSGTFTGQSAAPILASYTADGFVFYGIGIGINANIGELADLVGVNNVFETVNAEQLQYVVGWLLNKACTAQPTSSPSGGSPTPWSTLGTTAQVRYRACEEYCAAGDTSSGVKPIFINGNFVNVFCNGCWTTIQSRANGAVDFNVSFERYRQVLGEATTELSDFYLGNDNIYALTTTFNMQLWVQPGDCNGGITNALYSWFKIGSLSEGFRLNTSYAIRESDAGDAFHVSSFGISNQGRKFSTANTYEETGGLPARFCTSLQYGGWWHGSCKDNLNGKWSRVYPHYCEATVPDGIRWIRPGNFTLTTTQMFVCSSYCPQPF